MLLLNSAPGHQCRVRPGDRTHAADRAEPIRDIDVQRVSLRRFVTVQGRADAKEQDVQRIEADVDSAKVLHRPEEQSRADQEHERDRHLRHDQRLAEAGSRAGDGPGVVLESGIDVRSSRAERRRDAEHDAGRRADDDGKCEPAPIEWRRLFRHALQQWLPPPRDHEPKRTADAGEEEALAQELSNQPDPRGAQRQAQGELRLPRRGAREQQVGHVGADDQQHEPDNGRQHHDAAELAGVHVVDAAAA